MKMPLRGCEATPEVAEEEMAVVAAVVEEEAGTILFCSIRTGAVSMIRSCWIEWL